VTPVGLGAGQVGNHALSEAEASILLNTALDLGVNLIDTARGYGLSEERIGHHLAGRREEFLLSTKVGYDVPGHEDWTPGAVIAGIDRARGVLRTDTIDIVHLHSCGLSVLLEGGVIDALLEAKSRGWLTAAAYSGENAELAWAIASGRFDSVECSVNVCDQRVLPQVQAAADAGLGVIAKRPLANAPWRHANRPVGQYVEAYWDRWQAMQPALAGLPPDEVALRFAAFAPGVSCAITGTASPANLARNVSVAARGPLDPDHSAKLRAGFAAADPGDWEGQL
jgi:aryl-alcohol dehydrogenase-like predicted oxidoreductase